MLSNYKVSAIVPAFNEENTVEKVLTVLNNCPEIDEVICVNDGSLDSTWEIISNLQLKKLIAINLDKNSGKGAAVAEGIKSCTGDITMFIDADLPKINRKHITLLLDPLLEGYKASLGYPNDTHVDKIFLKVGGQRAYFKNDLIPHLHQIADNKHGGLEITLNNLFEDKQVKQVPLYGLGHKIKYERTTDLPILIKYSFVWPYDIARAFVKRKISKYL